MKQTDKRVEVLANSLHKLKWIRRDDALVIARFFINSGVLEKSYTGGHVPDCGCQDCRRNAAVDKLTGPQ